MQTATIKLNPRLGTLNMRVATPVGMILFAMENFRNAGDFEDAGDDARTALYDNSGLKILRKVSI